MNAPQTVTKAQRKARREYLSKFRRPIPNFERHNEVIGGGFIVIERTDETKRLRPAAWPYECGSIEHAIESRNRLAEKYPDREFRIFSETGV